MRHIAFEGRCYFLGSCQYYTKASYPEEAVKTGELDGLPEVLCHGGSAIVSPMGEVLAGPLWDGEGILTAEMDLAEVVRARYDFDVAGSYSRPDVFKFLVDEREKKPADFGRE
jgi:nitrilase